MSRRRSASVRSRPYATLPRIVAAALKRRQPYASGWKPCSRTYFVTVKLRPHRPTVPSSIRSASSGRRIATKLPIRLLVMPEPTRDDVDRLLGPATPHFAYQLRARVRELVLDLPEDHDVRKYAEEKIELLDRLGYASSKAAEARRGRRTATAHRSPERGGRRGATRSPRTARAAEGAAEERRGGGAEPLLL